MIGSERVGILPYFYFLSFSRAWVEHQSVMEGQIGYHIIICYRIGSGREMRRRSTNVTGRRCVVFLFFFLFLFFSFLSCLLSSPSLLLACSVTPFLSIGILYLFRLSCGRTYDTRIVAREDARVCP